jgi:hypothetical protein
LVWLHVPVPEQCEGGWYVDPLHDVARPQETLLDACWQAPPTQNEVLPQGGAAAQRPCGSTLLSVTFWQVPELSTLQAWQTPQLLVEQQAPSTQLPEPHSLPLPHDDPSPFLAAQLPGELLVPVQ